MDIIQSKISLHIIEREMKMNKEEVTLGLL